MKPLKPLKPLKNAHTPNTKIGMGDNYGTGVKNNIGKMRGDSVGQRPVSAPKLKRPPRSLA